MMKIQIFLSVQSNLLIKATLKNLVRIIMTKMKKVFGMRVVGKSILVKVEEVINHIGPDSLWSFFMNGMSCNTCYIFYQGIM